MILGGFEDSDFDVSLVHRKVDVICDLCEEVRLRCRDDVQKGNITAEEGIVVNEVICEISQITECCEELSLYIARSDVGLLEK